MWSWLLDFLHNSPPRQVLLIPVPVEKALCVEKLRPQSSPNNDGVLNIDRKKSRCSPQLYPYVTTNPGSDW